MSLVFAGVCSHAPGITGRAHLADPALRDPFHAAFRRFGDEMRATAPDARGVAAHAGKDEAHTPATFSCIAVVIA